MKLLLTTRSFWNVVRKARNRLTLTDATQLMHSIMCALQDLPYFNVLHAFAPRIVLAMSLQKRCLQQASGARMETPSYTCSNLHSFVWSGQEFVFGSNSSSARNSSSGGKSSSWNSSSEFVFGKQSVFGGQFALGFGIRLRVGIRLREGIHLRGIRLRNSSSRSNSSSGGHSSSEFVFGK